MSDRLRCASGEWVEVERVLLEPADRSPNLPPETASQPMLVWVTGFASAEADRGDEVEIETMTGRLVTGRLSAINPGYYHTFGDPVPELVAVGRDLRAQLAAYRKAGE
ncbi:MAG: 2-amino-4-ketopentanoate thiolase [Actinobacteria bacterium]|nr:2-amino-4-ketopentanoate thiolase [Actinomycetota bacterium]MCG2807226.1 2-amino-4-ketopentanoate thiolase [Coriobacteriia bacterium]